jgi:hypothetical protein
MRADAKILLERLGRSDFRYREFVDRFADLESWPIFEALLRDGRVMPQDEAAMIEAATPGDSLRQPAPQAQPAPVFKSAPAPEPVMPTAQPEARAPEPRTDAMSRPAPSRPRSVDLTAEAPPPASTLFGRYGRPERAQNIRSLLQRLSDAVEGGED